MKKRLKFDHLSTLCVGLDIGSRGNFITALNFDSDRLINMRPVPNTASGVEAAGYFRGFNADYARLHGVVVRDPALGVPSIKPKGGVYREETSEI